MYIDSYVLTHATEGLPHRVEPPFLARSLRNQPKGLTFSSFKYQTRADLQLRIALGNYRIFYQPETEDYYHTFVSEQEVEESDKLEDKALEGAKKRVEAWADAIVNKPAPEEAVDDDEVMAEDDEVVVEAEAEAPVEVAAEAEPEQEPPVAAEPEAEPEAEAAPQPEDTTAPAEEPEAPPAAPTEPVAEPEAETAPAPTAVKEPPAEPTAEPTPAVAETEAAAETAPAAEAAKPASPAPVEATPAE